MALGDPYTGGPIGHAGLFGVLFTSGPTSGPSLDPNVQALLVLASTLSNAGTGDSGIVGEALTIFPSITESQYPVTSRGSPVSGIQYYVGALDMVENSFESDAWVYQGFGDPTIQGSWHIFRVPGYHNFNRYPVAKGVLIEASASGVEFSSIAWSLTIGSFNTPLGPIGPLDPGWPGLASRSYMVFEFQEQTSPIDYVGWLVGVTLADHNDVRLIVWPKD